MTIQAVILLGGQGTRLRALYPHIPKALVPVAGRPFLQHQLEWLSKGLIRRVHLAAGHLSEQIEAWVAAQRLPNLSITISHEPAPLGTAGALKFAEPFIQSDPFIVVNGDTLVPSLDFQALKEFVRKNPMIGRPQPTCSAEQMACWACLVVAPIEDASRYGTVLFDEQERVVRFAEKGASDKGWVNAGVYLMPRAVLSLIPAGQDVSLEYDIFPKLVEQRTLCVFPTRGPLLDMGTPEGLQAMEHWFSSHLGGA